MKRWLANSAVGTSFVVFVAVCVLAMRARTGSDVASLTYFRYLPDKSVRSTELHLTSDYRGVSLGIGAGHVGPFNGQLVWGYHVNADQSGGLPKLHVRREPYDGLSRWIMEQDEKSRSAIPLSWSVTKRTQAVNGDDSIFLHLRISYALLALLFSVPPIWKLNRMRAAIFER